MMAWPDSCAAANEVMAAAATMSNARFSFGQHESISGYHASVMDIASQNSIQT
jgi:hypothetical protein